MGGWGSSSKRGPDKTAGDKTAVMQGSSKIKEEKSVSEDTEIQEISKKEDLDEAFKVGTLKLKDGSTVKVNESTAKVLNNALSQLSASNKKRMETEAMKSKSSFESMVKFAKATV
jgi:CTP-dependent riboflavin kinase